MKVHTSGFKNQIKQFGRELDSKITYTLNNEEIVLGNEDLNAITPHYEGDILKSVMKQLDIDSNVEIPTGTELNYQFGVLVNGDYEYIDFGNYIVYSSEKQEDTFSWRIVCYDKMLYSMKDYEILSEYEATQDTTFAEEKTYYEYDGEKYEVYDGETTGNPSALGLYELVNLKYPITIREYLSKICQHLGLVFANENGTFVNYDKQLENELYVGYDEESEGYISLNYTFRDVLDEIAGATASTICINTDDELEVRYVVDTEDTIDEEYLKDINVNFGKMFGPVNSIVLSRSAESDNIYKRNDASIEANGLTEIKIIDNQILNGNNRDLFIDEIYNQLNGFYYYGNDFSSTGIGYYDLCDRYNVSIDNNTYSCVMMNDEFLVTQGLAENIHSDIPEKAETDYSKADTTDKRIRQAYIIVDKQNGVIRSEVKELNEKLYGDGTEENKGDIASLGSRIEQTKEEIKLEVSSEIDDKISSATASSVKTTTVTINDEGLSVATDTSEISTTMTNEEFKITHGSETLAWFGYDNTTNETKSEVNNLTVDKYFVVGNHRVEKYENNGEQHTGFFYIGGS